MFSSLGVTGSCGFALAGQCSQGKSNKLQREEGGYHRDLRDIIFDEVQPHSFQRGLCWQSFEIRGKQMLSKGVIAE